MTHSHIDHLVITAPDLETGCQWVEQQLGVPMQPGGEHPLMGTHNRLLSLGPDCYLEVIACSPTLPAPATPRWFGMDQLNKNSLPMLTTWVARSGNIAQLVTQASENPGPMTPMFRGDINWQITIPANGSLLLEGTAPALIQWPQGQQPAAKLADQGLRLEQLELCHSEPERLKQFLKSIAIEAPVTITASQTPKLVAHIKTATGTVLLQGLAV